MMKNIAAFLLLFTLCSSAQTLYTPYDVQKAYKNGTRTPEGNPGSKYWQNHASYTMYVSLTPPDAQLQGQSQITYFNNSPDTLKEIVFRLYPNLYKLGAERDFSLSAEDLHPGVDFTSFKVRGKEQLTDENTSFRQSETVLTIKLEEHLPPASSVNFEIAWNYPLPSKSNVRMGRYDSTSWFVAYWYPQIAVYDDVFGWDKIPYTGQKEYYNNFNDYTVTIDLPESFCAWATGELQNAADIMPDALLEKFTAAHTSEKVINLITKEEAEKGYKMKGREGRVQWNFTAMNVPDFAFALSDHYLWDAVSVVVDSTTMRRALVNAAYKSTSKDYYEVADFSRTIMAYFSHVLPGVPYPYPVMTVYNGQGGMEFPMMCNNGSTSRGGAFSLAAHEIAHTYFPFYMGINEKRYAWMDEGWAVMLPMDLVLEHFPDIDLRNRNAKAFNTVAGTEFEIPLYIPSQQTSGSAYRIHAYTRPGMAYYILRDALGKDNFDKALREYMKRWRGKHPLPNDFFYSFNNYLKDDISWFWKPWFFESGYAELFIKSAVQKKNDLTIIVEREGNLPVPVKLLITLEDGTTISKYETAAVWKTGLKEKKYTFKVSGKVESVLLGDLIIPDKVAENNFVKLSSTKK
ncbi:MAG: hypothetical protein FMNOHCHN_02428 [Ignavibacteriaceae bacterium]|nr:hypothetical protein [Ignavibacteriaceae bacterium]